MRIPSILSILFTIACSAEMKSASDEAGLIGHTDRPAWDPDPQTIDNGSSSSTVSWSPPDDETGTRPHHYDIRVTSEFGTVVVESSTEDSIVELNNLRTDTEYSIDISACFDESCSDLVVGEPIQAPTWRTEIESWVFPQINGGDITPLFNNAYAPTLINLKDLQIGLEGWLLTNIVQDGSNQQIQVSILRDLFFDDDSMIDFVFETPSHAGVQDVQDVIEFTSSSSRPVKVDGEWTLELFVSLSATVAREREMIGSWISNSGVTNINIAEEYGYESDVCAFESLSDVCGMNTVIDSESDSQTLASMDCISIIPNLESLMLIQGRTDRTDNTPPNLYLAEYQGDGAWETLGDQSALPLLKDATGASVHVEDELGKLYYWDENSGSAYIRYWDATQSGDEQAFEIADLEGEDRVRHVYYTDQGGTVMLPWDFKVVERSFLTKDEQQIMLATVETGDGQKHITFGVLTNP